MHGTCGSDHFCPVWTRVIIPVCTGCKLGGLRSDQVFKMSLALGATGHMFVGGGCVYCCGSSGGLCHQKRTPPLDSYLLLEMTTKSCSFSGLTPHTVVASEAFPVFKLGTLWLTLTEKQIGQIWKINCYSRKISAMRVTIIEFPLAPGMSFLPTMSFRWAPDSLCSLIGPPWWQQTLLEI